MKIIIDRLSKNLVWELIHNAAELSSTKVIFLEDVYLLQNNVSKRSYDVTDSMLTLHNLCESSEFASNLFCLFQNYTVVATPSFFRFMYGCNIVTFLKQNRILVFSTKGKKVLNASDPDTFGALQSYLR